MMLGYNFAWLAVEGGYILYDVSVGVEGTFPTGYGHYKVPYHKTYIRAGDGTVPYCMVV